MKWVLIISTLVLNGCAVYTVTSSASYLVTDKTLTDHALTQLVPNGNCTITNVLDRKYYCEIKDHAKTYNRSAF